MALPDSFYTADRIVRLALKDAGRAQIGQEPPNELYDEAMERLQDLVVAFVVKGLKLWLTNLRSLTLVANQAAYTIDVPRELKILEIWYVRSEGNRQPVEIKARSDFYNLGNLTNTGTPVAALPDKQQDRVVLTVWPIPTAQVAADGTLEMTVLTESTAPTELSDELAFPREWYLALRWGLADELATGQPIPIMERCQVKAKEYREDLESWDVEEGPLRLIPAGPAYNPSSFSRR